MSLPPAAGQLAIAVHMVTAAMAASTKNKVHPGCAKYKRVLWAGTALQPEMQI